MSEHQQGTGWWLASDGRWYPPTAQPGLPQDGVPSGPLGSTSPLDGAPFGAAGSTSLSGGPVGGPGPYPAQPYGQGYQPYGYQPYGYPGFVAPRRTSGLAIASMVLGILWIYWIGSILAVVFGHIALSQTRRDPSLDGRGMAIAGVVLGYVGIGFLAAVFLFFASL